ncbi:hypothetical protein BTO15_15740 [Polaribacter sejongensis]|uniref:Signal transduction histidine kinase internal region domain-containing protein n=1 Tax=Polaribacter sejongensis TaxID=985043 RepID=A0ABN5F9F4_9FLAO|nr:hypothetical protein [Polaribacter sejongensis]AUC23464.1 hypothetical protein BTO15_15740 [Polaribacter sejongensis]
MNTLSRQAKLLAENEKLMIIILILLSFLVLIIIRNWYNLYKKRSFRRENTLLKAQLQSMQITIKNDKKKLKNTALFELKLKNNEAQISNLNKNITDYKEKFYATLSDKEKKIAQQKVAIHLQEKDINHQRKAYERYVDFKNVEANNTRLGAHFIKNVISQIYEDLEETELSYKTIFGIQYKRIKDKKKIPSVKALKNIFKLLDYNVSALNTESTTIEDELIHINMFLELIQYLKPNAKILMHDSLTANQKNTIRIKPTLFFPFLENALKHGSLNNESSFISIDLKENKQKELSYCLVNSTEQVLINKVNEKISSKFGLNALKQLVDTYYPGSKIESTPISNNQYLAQLTLTIK